MHNLKASQPGKIAEIVIKNRLVRSATFEYMGTDETVEEVLAEGSVDFCAMARPFVKEPDLANRWLSGLESARAKCVSCNACLPHPGRTLTCRVTEQPSEREALEKCPYFKIRGGQ